MWGHAKVLKPSLLMTKSRRGVGKLQLASFSFRKQFAGGFLKLFSEKISSGAHGAAFPEAMGCGFSYGLR